MNAINSLYENAINLSYETITSEVENLTRGLNKVETLKLAKEFGIRISLASKKAAVFQISRKISERKMSYDRVAECGVVSG